MTHRKISGHFIAGLVEGEGCFYINFGRMLFWKRRGRLEYPNIIAGFAMSLRIDDTHLCKEIQKVMGCGNISNSKNNVRFEVRNYDDVYSKVSPFFKKFPLHGKKRKVFNLWSRAVKIMYKTRKKKESKGLRKIPWTKKDIATLGQIKREMEQYMSRGTGRKKIHSRNLVRIT